VSDGICRSGNSEGSWELRQELGSKTKCQNKRFSWCSVYQGFREFLVVVLFCILRQGLTISLCSPGWPQTGDSPASASQGVGLQV
jgi:hypothetical protein